MTPVIEVREERIGEPHGLEALLAEAWTESGRRGSMPYGWRPFDAARAVLFSAREEGRLEGVAAARPTDGMDSLELLYVRRRARGGSSGVLLLERAAARLREIGRTRIIYAGYGWWRAPFPPELAAPFAATGFRRFEGVFLARPLAPGAAPPPAALPPGYAFADWTDGRFEEVCGVMLRSPEPEALYWDIDLCRRSVSNAAQPVPPLFRDGLAQLVVREGDRSVAAFTLATTAGYVNHVYTDPAERGRGLASAMLARLLEALGRLGVASATILTHETNPGAIALYERLGFRVDFKYPQFYIRHEGPV